MDMERQQQTEEEAVEDEEQDDTNDSNEDLLATESSEAEVLKRSLGFSRVRRALKQDSVDRLLMTIAKGFSVLVGLVWDIAFFSAESVIITPGAVPGSGLFNFIGVKFTEHPVKAKCVLCALFVACVLPAWWTLLVPHSRRKVLHHFQDIKREEMEEQEQRSC